MGEIQENWVIHQNGKAFTLNTVRLQLKAKENVGGSG